MVNIILDSLAAGEPVRVSGLGTFNVAERPARGRPRIFAVLRVHARAWLQARAASRMGARQLDRFAATGNRG